MADIVENPQTGERKIWRNGRWADLPSSTAPGANYLTQTFDFGNKSEDAYWRQTKDKDNTAVAGARTGVRNAARAENLLRRQEQQGQGTGGIYGVPVIGGAAAFLDPELRELDAIQAETARSKRQPGEGAISDFDAQQFLNMTYGRDKPLATNKALIQAGRAADDAAIQRRHFMEWHKDTFGHVNGSEEAWDRYSQDNPIFDPSAADEGRVALNAKRTAWREFFGAVRSEGDRRPSQAQSDAAKALVPAALRKAPADNMPTGKAIFEIHRMKKAGEFDGAKPRGDQANPFVAVNPNVAKRLPKGSFYLDGNGDLWKN